MKIVTELPDDFKTNIIKVHDKAGKEWLDHFDNLVNYCMSKWRLKTMPAKKLSYNFVAPVLFENGSKAILKLGIPGSGFLSEIAALKAFNGAGSCKLLDTEPNKGIMILEDIESGDPLNTVVDENQSAKITADLIKRMQEFNPVTDYPFQTSRDWYNDLGNLNERFVGVLPDYLFRNAMVAYQFLETYKQEQRLLHGDLHHENILSAGNGTWKAIDPKGIIAELGCELPPYLVNNLDGKDISATISKRISIMSHELKMDKIRIIRWGIFRSVLSAYWKLEDSLPVTEKDTSICDCFLELIDQA